MLLSISTGVSSIVQLITLIIVFAIVLILTYYTTRFVGNYQKANSINSNIKPIETYRISNTKYIQMLRIGKKIVVISVTKDNVTKITELDEDDIELENNDVDGQDSFSGILEKMKNIGFKNKDKSSLEEDNKR